LALHPRSGVGIPVPLLRVSAAMWRKFEAVRDQVMLGVGTGEPWFYEDLRDVLGPIAVAAHYRRPLRLDEVNQLAATGEVRARPGRP
jgi:hypothetical protein